MRSVKSRLYKLEAKLAPDDSGAVDYHIVSPIKGGCITIWRMRGRELVRELPGCGHGCQTRQAEGSS